MGINMQTVWKDNGFLYNGIYRKLNDRAILLDGGLSEEEAACHPHVYRDIHEAFHSPETAGGSPEYPVTMYIAPNVYWIDDPDAEDMLQRREGERIPFGMRVACGSLKLEGLSEKPEDVVIAGNRGQSHACCGNYTMFLFQVQELTVSNLTLGNYCSVDLVYPLNPSLNRVKRTETITQAQLAFQKGEKLYAENCRFVSRLNLNPICGAERALYHNCHFESTDDALNGNAVYVSCDFDFYGSRPIFQATGTGDVFIDCIFRSRIKGGDGEPCQYLTKEGGPVALIDCRFESEADAGVWLGWTKYPLSSLKCYQHQVSLNGKPVRLGGEYAGETVSLQGRKALEAYIFEKEGKRHINTGNLLGGEEGWDPLGELEDARAAGKLKLPTLMRLVTDRESIISERDTAGVTAEVFSFWGKRCQEKVRFFLEEQDEPYAEVVQETDDTCILRGKNKKEGGGIRVDVHACTESGLEAAVTVLVKPTLIEAPRLLGEPVLQKEGEFITVLYELSSGERADASEISWYRCSSETGEDGVLCAVTRSSMPRRRYHLTGADIGSHMKAVIVPRLSGGLPGEAVEITAAFVIEKQDTDRMHLFTDFSELPDGNQREIREGCWTLDCERPADIKLNSADFGNWEMDTESPAWTYGPMGNGKLGMYQNTQGARLRYTPVKEQCGNMSLTVKVDPAKTAGQGFGIAGQYMDVGIQFDTERLTGYALRVIRVKEASDAVAMALVEYREGRSRYLTEKCMTSCFLTGCTIKVKLKGKQLTAAAETTASISPDRQQKGYARTVKLEAEVSGNHGNGILIWHTGTPGTGGWQNTALLRSVEVSWE